MARHQTPNSYATRLDGWYCINVQPRWEQSLADQLTILGAETFLPKLLVTKSSTESSIQPLFPGYFFVRFTPDIIWQRCYSLPGMNCILSIGSGHPSKIRDSVINTLREFVGPAGVVDVNDATPSLVGKEVVVLSGPYKDFSAVCTATHGERARILLSIFGRMCETSVLTNSLQERT